MQTVSWGDLNHTRDAGTTKTRGKAILISGDNIASWLEDPDGRFELIESVNEEAPAELGKFYPSL